MEANNSFLEAIKARAGQTVTPRACGRIPTAPLTHPDSLADPIKVKVDPSFDVVIEQAKPLQVTVELVLDRNRIDVTFDRKPDAYALSMLKANGFWYRPTDKAWFNKDGEPARAILREMFGVEIEAYEPVKPIEVVIPVPEVVAPVPLDPTFEAFKGQVDELMAELQVSAADLMLMAIEALHSKVFGARDENRP